MIHYWIFIDEPEKELNPFTVVYNVKIGSNANDQKLLQRISTLSASNPQRYFFHIVDKETTEFVHRLIDEGFHPFEWIPIRDLWRKIK